MDKSFEFPTELTDEEKTILVLLIKGFSSGEIADKLGVSLMHTLLVISELRKKFGVKSEKEFVRIVQESGSLLPIHNMDEVTASSSAISMPFDYAGKATSLKVASADDESNSSLHCQAILEDIIYAIPLERKDPFTLGDLFITSAGLIYIPYTDRFGLIGSGAIVASSAAALVGLGVLPMLLNQLNKSTLDFCVEEARKKRQENMGQSLRERFYATRRGFLINKNEITSVVAQEGDSSNMGVILIKCKNEQIPLYLYSPKDRSNKINQWLVGNFQDEPDYAGVNINFPSPAILVHHIFQNNLGTNFFSSEAQQLISENPKYLDVLFNEFKVLKRNDQEIFIRNFKSFSEELRKAFSNKIVDERKILRNWMIYFAIAGLLLLIGWLTGAMSLYGTRTTLQNVLCLVTAVPGIAPIVLVYELEKRKKVLGYCYLASAWMGVFVFPGISVLASIGSFLVMALFYRKFNFFASELS